MNQPNNRNNEENQLSGPIMHIEPRTRAERYLRWAVRRGNQIDQEVPGLVEEADKMLGDATRIGPFALRFRSKHRLISRIRGAVWFFLMLPILLVFILIPTFMVIGRGRDDAMTNVWMVYMAIIGVIGVIALLIAIGWFIWQLVRGARIFFGSSKDKGGTDDDRYMR